MSLVLEHLSKRFGKHSVLQGISLEIAPGKAYAIIGPNGAGKTTLIKSILGFYRHSGKVTFFGLPFMEALAKQRVGYLPERLTFSPLLTSLGYLELQAKLRGIKFSILKKTTIATAEQLGLTPWLNTPLYQFSKGMTRKLAFLQAVMHQPQLLILDEPTDGLDPVARRIVLHMILDMLNEGTTVLITSHLLSDIERVAQNAGILLQGKIVAETNLRSLKSFGQLSISLREEDNFAHDYLLHKGSTLEINGKVLTVANINYSNTNLEDWYLDVVSQQVKEGLPV